MSRMNREAYQKLVDENLQWLIQQPRSLERDHIEMILKASVNHEYGDPIASLESISFSRWNDYSPVLIIHGNDNEEWHNQTGGHGCYQSSVKGDGYLLPNFEGECLCGQGDGRYESMQAQLNAMGLPITIDGGTEADLEVTVLMNGEKRKGTIYYNNCD
jgi:hypothetical protein